MCERLYSKIPELLDAFDIEYVKKDSMYTFCCPVHGGDNQNGCTIFDNGKHNWVCWTHSCQEQFKRSLIGFIRGVLSYRQNRLVSLHEAMDFSAKLLNCDIDDIPIVVKSNNHKYVKMLEIFTMSNDEQETIQGMPDIKILPSQYYVDRAYSEEVLLEFNVGDSFDSGYFMSNRAIVPYYDENNNYLGCAGRSLLDSVKPKWINSKGLKKSQVLYGIHIARPYILDTGSVIIVEGPGDVWRLNEAGFKNSVAISGASLSESQLLSLEVSGCMKIIILTDNDDAGEKACNQIIKKCGRRFNYVIPEIPIEYKDIGEMDIESIKELLEKY